MKKRRKIFILVFLLGLFSLFLITHVFASSTQTRRPTGDNSATATWTITGGSARWEAVTGEAANDTTYITPTSTGNALFSFSPFSIPAGATVENLTVYFRHKRKMGASLKVGGTIDEGSVTNQGASIETSSTLYSTNPKTGSAWTTAEVNGIGSNTLEAFGVYTSKITPAPDVTQVYAVVTYNSAPFGGYTADNVIPAAQCAQSADGDGIVTISFRIKDGEQDLCTLESFQYSTDGGSGWSAPTNGDISGALSSGWTNNSGSSYSSATDWSGTVHSFTFNTKHADVSGFDGVDQDDVRVRFTINDGTVGSASPVASEDFTVDNVNPAALVATDITSRPDAGGTTVTLDCSFTENHPNTNTFYAAINGGAYGSGTAGDADTADPSAQATAVGAALDGNDYISKVKCVHSDDYGNAGTNENTSPSLSAVKPYTPAVPTVSSPTASTVDVALNKNASEATGLEYAIYVSSHSKYVQTDGTLGVSAAWQTIANWGTRTVTGLSAPVSDYTFKAKARNPNGDQPESDLSGGASSANTAPVLNNGTTENILPALSQATDRSGDITITFRLKDIDIDTCSVVSGSFQYQVNGGGWNSILDADITGTKTGLSSAAGLSGALHTLVWDTSKEYIDDALNSDVQIRFKINDGTVDSAYGVSPTGFDIDNLDPATLVTTDIYTQPNAGDTTVTLDSAFTEQNPNTNTFYVAINGGGYGSGTAGDVNTADPSPQAADAGVTLDGNDYINKVKCRAVDDFGNVGDNENTGPDSAKKYVKPYTPAVPTVNNGTSSTVDVAVNKNPNEVLGLDYAIYVSSHTKYVQSDGTLGDSAVWQGIADWGTITVSGLSSPISDYYFKTKSRNSSDTTHQASSESDFSDAINTTGVPATPEVIASYSPAAGAEGVSPEAVVTVLFDRDMDTGSVEDIFSMKAIYDNSGNILNSTVSGAFSWSANRQLTFTPSADLTKGYTYRVALSGDIKDGDGNDLAIDFTWSFRVVLDRQIQNIFFSADGKAKVVLALGAISNDGSVDINRNPINSPREVSSSSIEAANAKVLAESNDFLYPFTSSITEINAYGTDDILITDDFSATVTVTLYYNDENSDGYVDGTDPPILERGLRIYWLDEVNSLWVRLPGSTVDTDSNYVSASVPHFSVYTLMATPASSLADAYAFPNPFKPSDGHTAVTFTNLSSVSTIKIFTLTGTLVKTIVNSGGEAQATWDVKNDAGEDVASGLYLFVITSADDKKSGKLVVIR